MSWLGIFLICASLAVPLVWLPDMAVAHGVKPIAAQYFGMVGLITMAIAQLIATRTAVVEWLFGGLDRAYKLHKWLGIGAIAAVFLHDSIGAEIETLRQRGLLAGIAEDLGSWSYNGLLALCAASVLMLIPYRWWYWTHRVIGLLFVLGVAHFVLVQKPFADMDPIGLYVLAFCAIGVISYVYTQLPWGRQRAAHRYVVRAVTETGGAIAIDLAARSGGLPHRSGQFAFFSFAVPGLEERHPFTISKAPDDSKGLRVTIKPLGDYTREIGGRLSPGVAVAVEGPFGRFTRQTGDKPEVWIAGGIGITPFVAWAQALAAQAQDRTEVHLFFCVKDTASAPHLTELQAIAAGRPGFHLHLVDSSRMPRLTAEGIASTVGQELKGAQVYFCGPQAMRDALRASLKAQGVPSRRFHYEEFEIRSGIGIERGLAWLADRAPASVREALRSIGVPSASPPGPATEQGALAKRKG